MPKTHLKKNIKPLSDDEENFEKKIIHFQTKFDHKSKIF